MEELTELKELYLQCCEAMSRGDYLFFARRFSQKEGVLAIGTDPTEWLEGYAAIAGVFKSQLEQAGGFLVLPGTPRSHRDGSIGWVAGRPAIKLPNGSEIPARLTAVFQQDQGDWKIVQWHFSVGISNEDLIGETLTTQ